MPAQERVANEGRAATSAPVAVPRSVVVTARSSATARTTGRNWFAGADVRASRSFAGRDNDWPARHGSGGHDGSPDSVGRQRAEPRAAPSAHSLVHNKFGHDRSGCRPALERGTARTETAGPSLFPVRVAMDDIRREWNTAPAFVPSTVWGTAPNCDWLLRSAPCRPRQIRALLIACSPAFRSGCNSCARRGLWICGQRKSVAHIPTGAKTAPTRFKKGIEKFVRSARSGAAHYATLSPPAGLAAIFPRILTAIHNGTATPQNRSYGGSQERAP